MGNKCVYNIHILFVDILSIPLLQKDIVVHYILIILSEVSCSENSCMLHLSHRLTLMMKMYTYF